MEQNNVEKYVRLSLIQGFVFLFSFEELTYSDEAVDKHIQDIRYPIRFGNLPDMPVVIYVKGNLKINNFVRSIGIVGARRCSAEGKAKAIEMSESEIEKGAAIISGMAKGIDSYAHTAAVKNGGYTIAVLGNGTDVSYPKEHQKLYDEIAENDCIMSEYPPGTQPSWCQYFIATFCCYIMQSIPRYFTMSRNILLLCCS